MSTTQSLLIRHAEIILPNGESMIGDVLTQGRRIVQLGQEITSVSPTHEIDARGLTLLPGVIDPQVHFREPGLEHKEDLFTASCACARGGVTSFLEMPNTRPLTISQSALDDKLQRAASKCLVNYGFFIGATGENLPDLLSASPTPGIKVFMGSMHGQLLVSQEEVLEAIFAQGNRLIAVHAEDQARINQRKQEFAG
ncbi:MAG: amidohydrolase family protein, partial [Dolichospermum sp.]